MIRFPTPSDRLAIGHVYCTAWKAAYRGIIPSDYLDGLTDESCAPRSIGDKGSLICEAGGKIVGATRFGARRDRKDAQTGELYSIYVLPERWSTGVGRALFEAAREELRADGFEAFFLWALTDNLRAVRFYERMGMTACETRTVSIGGKEVSETRFHQTLI